MHTRLLQKPVTIQVMGQSLELNAERFFHRFEAAPQPDGTFGSQIIVSRVLGVLRDSSVDPNEPTNFVPASQFVPDEIVVIDDQPDTITNDSFDPEKPENEDNPRTFTIQAPDFSDLNKAKGQKKAGQFRTDDVVAAFDNIKSRRGNGNQ